MAELRDDEIVIRPHTMDDVQALTAICQDPDVARRTHVPSPYTQADARDFIETRPGAGAILESRTGELVRNIGFRLVDQDNVQIGSQRVAEKAGFQRDGLLRRYLQFRDGRRRDGVMFSLVADDL